LVGQQAQLTTMQACMDEACAEVARLGSACHAAESLAFNLQAAAGARQSEARARSLNTAARCSARVAVATCALTDSDSVACACAAVAACAQLEARVSCLSADLASSREAAEGLRRDLHAAQTDGEGRNRQHDASTRDLRKELRDCDETIGHALHAMPRHACPLLLGPCLLCSAQRRAMRRTAASACG
jgi:phage shock protein A